MGWWMDSKCCEWKFSPHTGSATERLGNECWKIFEQSKLLRKEVGTTATCFSAGNWGMRSSGDKDLGYDIQKVIAKVGNTAGSLVYRRCWVIRLTVRDIDPLQRPKAVEVSKAFRERTKDWESPSQQLGTVLVQAVVFPFALVFLLLLQALINFRRTIWHSTHAMILFSTLRYFWSIIVYGRQSARLYRIIFLEICLLQGLNKYFVHINLPVSDLLAMLTWGVR